MTAVAERAMVAPRLGVARFSALVVIGDPLARASAVRGLEELGAVSIGEAASAAEARIRLQSGLPRDLIVAELDLPDGSGLSLMADLRASGRGRGVILSSTDDPYTVRAALAAGVRSFLVRGDSATRPSLFASPIVRGRGGVNGGPQGLSGREVEVLQLVADGKTNRDIGTALGLSALTVKSHLARIARKLGTGDRAEMVVVTLRAGVIS